MDNKKKIRWGVFALLVLCCIGSFSIGTRGIIGGIILAGSAALMCPASDNISILAGREKAAVILSVVLALIGGATLPAGSSKSPEKQEEPTRAVAEPATETAARTVEIETDTTAEATTETTAGSVTETEASAKTTTQRTQTVREWIVNLDSHVFHYPFCHFVDSMSEENKYSQTGTYAELISMGYEPCKSCNPHG